MESRVDTSCSCDQSGANQHLFVRYRIVFLVEEVCVPGVNVQRCGGFLPDIQRLAGGAEFLRGSAVSSRRSLVSSCRAGFIFGASGNALSLIDTCAYISEWPRNSYGGGHGQDHTTQQ